MNKEHVKGAAQKTKGKIKEAIGHVTGNKKLENQGKADEVKGDAYSAAGDAKDAAKEAAEHLKH